VTPPVKKDAKPRPIIIKRKKIIAGGHHGGAWKVAYADFVTAMMAFFLVMWLLAAVNPDQRAAIFEYFRNPSLERGTAPKAAPGQRGPGGASTSPIDLRGGLDARRTVEPAEPVDTAEHRQLESLLEELRQAVDRSQALKPFKDQLLLDITPDGLRLQIVDSQNRPMFDLGSTRLKDYTTAILYEVGRYLNSVPNRISISGHTDTTPYSGSAGGGYGNWELSADRANAARRALLAGGLEENKVTRVVGLSSSVLFDKANARNAVNRRIAIIVMTKRAERAALMDGRPELAEPP
jgi:chemotaxis protein MotB